jgi:hypothetical protein
VRLPMLRLMPARGNMPMASGEIWS